MKANSKILAKLTNRDDAVSPVIAVILMVAITVVLAATVYVWVSGFSGNNQKIQNSQLTAVGGDDIITLKHISGDAIAAGSWKLSVTPTTMQTFFCTPASAALSSGAQVVVSYTSNNTAGTAADCHGTSAFPDGQALAAGDYKVVIVETTTNTVLFDRIITVT